MDIAVIGSNMVDLITYTNQMPKEGETLEAPAFKIGCGGKGANQAVAAAKLNSKVLMLTKVGDDIFADNTIRNLESWGINTTQQPMLRRSPVPAVVLHRSLLMPTRAIVY